MEDLIIGAATVLILLAVIGIGSQSHKRRFGENFPGAKSRQGN
jgi:hypothetical protein